MVKIITDSSADFEPDELKKLGIICIPLAVSFGNVNYKENVDISKEKFYTLMNESTEFPKTSQPAFYDIINVFDEASGGEAVAILISSNLSGTYKNSLIAKSMSNNSGVHIIDGMSASAGQRILVEYAAELRDKCKSAEEIVKSVEIIRDNVQIIACINSLEYLHRGGRVGSIKTALTALANIKPIITLKNGAVRQSGKALGFRRGLKSIINKAKENKINTNFPCYIIYTDNKQAANEAADIFKQIGIVVDKKHIIQAGAVIGSHIGPNSVGIAYVSRK